MKKSLTLLVTFCLVVFALNAQQKLSNKDLKNRGLYYSLIRPDKNAQQVRTNQFFNTDLLPGVDQKVGYKAGNELKQKLDYMTWDFYDGASGSMITLMREEYTYDIQARTDQTDLYMVDEPTGEWKLYSRTTETYDANGNWLTRINSNWNSETGLWIPFRKNEYSYDENGHQNLVTSFEWDDVTQAWTPSFKSEYTWDAAGNRTLRIDSEWDPVTENWIPEYKAESTFDTNGRENLHIEYLWNIETSQWTTLNKYSLSYDLNGDMILEVDERWDAVTQTWLPEYKYDYTYNNDHQVTLSVGYDWETITGTWIPYYKLEIQYDNSGNDIQDVYSEWNQDSGQWEYDYKMEYTFDYDYLFEEILVPISLATYSDINNKILTASFITWNTNLGQWMTGDRSSYYYSDINDTGIDDNLPTPFEVYPNPTQNYIMIKSARPFESARIELFDVTGKKVMSEILSGNRQQVPVGALNSGLYYYRILQGQKIESGKLMIR